MRISRIRPGRPASGAGRGHRSAAAPGDPIERYLDRLLLELHGRATDVRRILAETEEHLRDAVAERVAAGDTEALASDRAIAGFGRPREIARRFQRRPAELPIRAVLAALVTGMLLLGAVGLLAIGASGAVAAGLGAAFGKDFVAGDAPGVTYTASRCADYREYEPNAPSCAAAAVAHHFGEVVDGQLAAGILGLIALAGHRAVRRALRRRDVDVGVLPDGFVATIGASVFGVAAGLLLFQGAGQLVFASGSGTGAMLGQGLAALAAAATFLPRLYRAVAVRAASSISE